MLGNVYQLPYEYSHLNQVEAASLLAGQPTGWNVEEVEVFSVKLEEDTY